MKTCLVVDDSNTTRKAILKILAPFNFHFVEAENGQEALERCLDQMPDIVILDWNMPIMNGVEFLKALRQTPDGDLPKVILCTTENDVSRIVEAMSCGADEYVMKPFSEDIIKDKLEIVGII